MKFVAAFSGAVALCVGGTSGHVTYAEDFKHEAAAEDAVWHAQAPLPKAGNACKLQPAKGRDSYLGLGFGPMTSFAPSVGPLQAAMVFVDFPDAVANDTTRSLYEGLMPGAAEWYNASSYGRLKLEVDADLSQFHRMASASSTYKWNRGLSSQSHGKYIKDSIAAVGLKAKFGKTDVLYVVPTRAASEISFSPTYMGRVTFADGTTVGKTVTFGQDLWKRWGYKVLNHETGHTLGLPDLYPMDYLKLPTVHFVGGWDLMGLISGSAPDYFAWHKWKLSWIDDEQVSCVSSPGASQHLLSPLAVAGGIKMVAVKLNETAALAMELRTKQGLDSKTCSEGLLFYVVSAAKGSGQGPITVLDPRTVKATGCAAQAGGQLSGAAMNAAKGETNIDLPQFGVSVKVTVQGQDYKLSVNYKARGSS